MNAPILHELLIHELLRERLQAEFPEADEETLLDTLEGLTSLPERLAALTRSYLEDQSLGQALRLRLDDMRQRLQRLEHTAEVKRKLLSTVMERAQLKRLTEPEFTLSLRQTPPALVVQDESVIPELYWKPQPAKLDRQALLAELKSGVEVPGVSLGDGGVTVSVRTK